jgi:hypothetical protein
MYKGVKLMFYECLIKNTFKSSLKIVPCQLEGLVTDLTEHEQEIISGSVNRIDKATPLIAKALCNNQ